MEFWGAEVKSGQSLVVDPGEKLLHLSQACLDDLKKAKGGDPISLFAKVGDLKLVLGFLSAEKSPQLMFDIVFDEKFELSHNWKNGSVHFTGYKSMCIVESDSEEDDAPPIRAPTLVDKGKAKVNVTEVAKKPIKSEQKEASSDDDDEFVGHQALAEGDSSKDFDESDDDSEEDEETPKKADVGKKRPAESSKTPANDKKPKFVTPEKIGSKKGLGLLLKRLVARRAASTQQLHTLQSRLGKNQLRPTSQSSRLLNQAVHSIANPATGRLTRMVHCKAIQRQSTVLQSERQIILHPLHGDVLGF